MKKLSNEEKFIQWSNKIVEEYKPILGLNLCDFKLIKGKTTEYLEFGIHHPYLDNYIYYSDKVVEDFNNNSLTKWDIVHELCHAITDRFYYVAIDRYIGKNELEDARENLTDTISSIIRNLQK